MSFQIEFADETQETQARIKVIGVGGSGNNPLGNPPAVTNGPAAAGRGGAALGVDGHHDALAAKALRRLGDQRRPAGTPRAPPGPAPAPRG